MAQKWFLNESVKRLFDLWHDAMRKIKLFGTRIKHNCFLFLSRAADRSIFSKAFILQHEISILLVFMVSSRRFSLDSLREYSLSQCLRKAHGRAEIFLSQENSKQNQNKTLNADSWKFRESQEESTSVLWWRENGENVFHYLRKKDCAMIKASVFIYQQQRQVFSITSVDWMTEAGTQNH